MYINTLLDSQKIVTLRFSIYYHIRDMRIVVLIVFYFLLQLSTNSNTLFYN